MSRDEIREALEGRFRQEVEQRRAAATAEPLEAIATLLETLVDEVKGLRQDVAAIKAGMPSAATDEQPPADAPYTVIETPSDNQRGPAPPPQEPTSAEQEWLENEADNRGQSEQG